MKFAVAMGVGALLATCVAGMAQPPEVGKPVESTRRIEVEASDATTTYANFSRVTGTPEEVVLQFGFNSEPTEGNRKPIVVDQQIVLNFYTAKRLAAALQATIDRHEQVFGEIETDVQKRVKRSP